MLSTPAVSTEWVLEERHCPIHPRGSTFCLCCSSPINMPDWTVGRNQKVAMKPNTQIRREGIPTERGRCTLDWEGRIDIFKWKHIKNIYCNKWISLTQAWVKDARNKSYILADSIFIKQKNWQNESLVLEVRMMAAQVGFQGAHRVLFLSRVLDTWVGSICKTHQAIFIMYILTCMYIICK